MEIKFFCPIWGLVPDYIEKINAPLAPVFEKIKAAGYNGVEMAIPLDNAQKKELSSLLSSMGMELIALQWAATETAIKKYLPIYEYHILSAAELNPIYINCHSGRDFFSFNENCQAIEKAMQLEQGTGIPVIHEIHRGRFTFHPYYTQNYLNEYPGLKLAADFSHWCNVSESLLEDQSASISKAIKHAVHIHSRVGHPQSCQVPDPRDQAYEKALAAHLNWWDGIHNFRKQQGEKFLTITPEFGPYPYMPAEPYTQKPLASQWEINCWMKDTLFKRYTAANY